MTYNIRERKWVLFNILSLKFHDAYFNYYFTTIWQTLIVLNSNILDIMYRILKYLTKFVKTPSFIQIIVKTNIVKCC